MIKERFAFFFNNGSMVLGQIFFLEFTKFSILLEVTRGGLRFFKECHVTN